MVADVSETEDEEVAVVEALSGDVFACGEFVDVVGGIAFVIVDVEMSPSGARLIVEDLMTLPVSTRLPRLLVPSTTAFEDEGCKCVDILTINFPDTRSPALLFNSILTSTSPPALTSNTEDMGIVTRPRGVASLDLVYLRWSWMAIDMVDVFETVISKLSFQ